MASVRDPSIRCLRVAHDFHDPKRHWASVCEIADDGALLVRPDQHVAWRAPAGPADPAAALAAAVDAVLERA